MEILADKIDNLTELFSSPGWGERVWLAAETIYETTDASVSEIANMIGESLVAGA